MSFIPQNRIKVFISSAQNIEGDFSWEFIRRKIKEKLQSCIYINPFIIEDSPNELPSNQHFTYNVQNSDLIVFLIKSEVRKGTATEFAVAKKFKKPFLVYFFKEENPDLDVISIKKEIEQNDYCTYCGCLEPSDTIEDKILNDVINNIIQYYKVQHYNSANESKEYINITPTADVSYTKPYSPTKMVMSYFSSCYNCIYDYIGYDYLKNEYKGEKSIFHDIGEKILKWLITGESFYDAEQLAKLIEKSKEIYTDIGWLSKRWEAIKRLLDGDLEEALLLEEQALTLARSAKMPEWIVKDILIDCRNFENEVNSQKKIMSYGRHQQELDASGSLVYLPVSDRFLEDVYSETIREEIKHETQSPNTVTFGTNLGTVINKIENYLFSAVLYGSYIHLIISRLALAQIFYKYWKITGNNYSIYSSLSLYLLNGSSKEFKQLLLKEWDNVYPTITSKADELWLLTDNISINYRDASKQIFIEQLGLYLSDKAFLQAETYLLQYSSSVYWGNAEAYFESIVGVMNRMNHKNLIVALTSIIKENRFNLGSTISKILINIDLKDIPDEILIELNSALTENIASLIERNGNPQFIAILEKQRPDIFSSLSKTPDNGLVGLQQLYYEINLDRGDWHKILGNLISQASTQFQANKSNSSYIGFAARPFYTIANIIDNYFTKEMEDILLTQYFPLCVEILNSQAPLPLKEDCIYSLCSVASCYIKANIAIPDNLRKAVSCCDISEDDEIPFISFSTRAATLQRLLILKVLLGIEGKDTLFQWCFEYSKKDINEREALGDCVLSFLKQASALSDVDLMVLSIVFQLADDEYFSLRLKGIDCLAYILTSKYKDMAEKKLFELTLDTAPIVRNHLIRVCCDPQFPNKELSKQIIKSLTNDANYAIRAYAKSKINNP